MAGRAGADLGPDLGPDLCAGAAACYGLRRANPFLGVVAVVKTETGRALSLDGVHWQVQILAHPPRGLWAGGGESDQLQYFRFGVWTQAQGLARVPLNPILDLDHMLRASSHLCEQIAAHLDQIPFPLAAELEQWLLDGDGAPLALLATTLDPTGLAEAGATEWGAGGRGDRPFVAPSPAPAQAPAPANRLAQVEALERLVRNRAGRRPNSQWFRPEGEARVGLDAGAPEGLAGRRLTAGDFPPLTLRSDWPQAHDAALVADYLAWLAPYLLTLPGLDDDTRRGLEASAVRHALAVDDLWRLYPRVLDPGLVTQARVEARLRRANA